MTHNSSVSTVIPHSAVIDLICLRKKGRMISVMNIWHVLAPVSHAFSGVDSFLRSRIVLLSRHRAEDLH